MKDLTNDKFMKFLIMICYVFIVIALIASIIIGITTQELISSMLSMVILTMVVLLFLFFSIIICKYDIELKRKDKTDDKKQFL